jgi:hypothetical protein
MDQSALESFVAALPHVQRTDNFGYAFFFVGDDHRLPFVTVAASDNEHDRLSNLDREGVFRVNIGVGKDTFQKVVGRIDPAGADYSALNVFMPHPDYWRQNFLCVLNPAGENVEETKRLIIEAHSIAEARWRRKVGPDRP